MYTARVYYWNPNGTNDIQILKNGEPLEFIEEALFGFSVEGESEEVSINVIKSYIACSPLGENKEARQLINNCIRENYLRHRIEF